MFKQKMSVRHHNRTTNYVLTDKDHAKSEAFAPRIEHEPYIYERPEEVLGIVTAAQRIANMR